MKLLICLLLTPLFSLSQENADTLSFNYTGVENVDSTSAKILFSRAKLFIAENFKSAKNVIQLDDPESNLLVIKGNIVPYIKQAILGSVAAGYVHFTMKIQTKDGKYKYTFYDFDHESIGQYNTSGGALTNKKPSCGTLMMSKNYWRQIKNYTDRDIVSFIDTLRAKMRSGEVSKQESF